MPLGSTGDEEMYFSSSLPSQKRAVHVFPHHGKRRGKGMVGKINISHRLRPQ